MLRYEPPHVRLPRHRPGHESHARHLDSHARGPLRFSAQHLRRLQHRLLPLARKSATPSSSTSWAWTLNYPIGQGGLAALFRSQLLYQFPLGVFGIAIATAVFPAPADAAAETGAAGKAHFRTIIQHGLRLTVFVGLPASVGLFMVRLPLCRVVFEGREFTLADSRRCAMIVAAYAPAIWAYSMTHVLTRAFYAVKNSKTPMIASVAMVALNFLLNITLVWFLGAAGLALATAICAIIQCVPSLPG